MMHAIANKCGEVWISTHPVLLFTYIAQFMPDVYRWYDRFHRDLYSDTPNMFNLLNLYRFCDFPDAMYS